VVKINKTLSNFKIKKQVKISKQTAKNNIIKEKTKILKAGTIMNLTNYNNLRIIHRK
jgi:hypothetical protein